MSDDTRHIGVAIGIPEPFGSELQRWRERLGDPNAHRIVPHVTLLPPTPVLTASLPEIEEHLRIVASKGEPFDIKLRGSATFWPVSPVVFVALTQGIAECEQLESWVRSGPLAREVGYPYHPHVTVAHDLTEPRLADAYAKLATYQAEFRVWGLSLFEQGPDLTWRPQRDLTFASGGLPGPREEQFTRRDDGW
jgi:2'-5' RNA ligase